MLPLLLRQVRCLRLAMLLRLLLRLLLGMALVRLVDLMCLVRLMCLVSLVRLVRLMGRMALMRLVSRHGLVLRERLVMPLVAWVSLVGRMGLVLLLLMLLMLLLLLMMVLLLLLLLMGQDRIVLNRLAHRAREHHRRRRLGLGLRGHMLPRRCRPLPRDTQRVVLHMASRGSRGPVRHAPVDLGCRKEVLVVCIVVLLRRVGLLGLVRRRTVRCGRLLVRLGRVRRRKRRPPQVGLREVEPVVIRAGRSQCRHDGGGGKGVLSMTVGSVLVVTERVESRLGRR